MKINHRVLRAITLAAGLLAGMAGARIVAGRRATLAAGTQPATTDGTRAPVLVELFTSEGCSSCPPADGLLVRLVQQQPVEGVEIIALEEHVDYWNRLGWVDPFSSQGFTARQSRYSDAFGLEQIYTPQMVVDGRAEFVGSDASRAEEAIEQAAHVKKAHVQIDRLPNPQRPESLMIAVRVEGLEAAQPADVVVAITEDKLSTPVPRGENAGHQWEHSPILRVSHAIGEAKPGAAEFSGKASLTLPGPWRRENLRVVVFVQEQKSRHILGVGAVTLSKFLASSTDAQSR
jgi:hypothetical protein